MSRERTDQTPAPERFVIKTVAVKALQALALTPVLAAVFSALIAAVFALPNGPIIENLEERREVLLSRRADNGRVIDA
ncbi:MAG: hypothetical protein AAGJ87_08795, partial [Pseudomonadota bacterium]